MLIKCFKLSKGLLFALIAILLIISIIYFFIFCRQNISLEKNSISVDNSVLEETAVSSNLSNSTEENYIKWFEFNVSYEVLQKTSQLDINSHTTNKNVKYNWIELISYLACLYGNNFSKFKIKDLDNLVAKLDSGKSIDEITRDMKNYHYYYEGYSAVLSQYIGNFGISETPINNADNSNTQKSISYVQKYDLKAFHPLAQNYSYSHYKDFGNSRSYGYNRLHLGNDLMGSIGTPVIAVESGYVEAIGWNQYGGWRIGIRSFDKKRYYYYAHLRKGHPFVNDIYEGKIVQAGDVIGYLGMTGYSTKEDTNNINIPHLHFGIQLIFNEVQKDGPNQIWIDVYNLVDFLKKNRSTAIITNTKTKDYERKYEIIDPYVPD